MSNNKALVIKPVDGRFNVSFNPEVVELKKSIIVQSREVIQVTCPEEQEIAVQRLGAIKGLTKATEHQRKEIKQPYWDACQSIDSSAKNFVSDLDKEYDRVERMVSGFQDKIRREAEARRQEEERKAREAQQAAETERKRLEEIEAKRAAAVQAEADRKAAAAKAQKELEERQAQKAIDAAEREAAAKTTKQKEKAAAESKVREEQAKKESEALEAKQAEEAKVAQEEQERLEMEAAQAEIDAQEAEMNQAQAEASAETVMNDADSGIRGGSIRGKIEIEVLDLHATYKAYPKCVRLEVSVLDVNDLVKSGVTEIPGLKITRRSKTQVKGVSPSLSLPV